MPSHVLISRALFSLLIGAAPTLTAQVIVVTDGLEAVTTMLDAQQRGRVVTPAAWDRLFASRGYQRLKERELAMRRNFTDSAFRAFVRSDTLQARTDPLREAAAIWSRIDIDGPRSRAAAYLPAGTRISAEIFPLIKPVTNSFVHRGSDGTMGIFMYVDPGQGRAELQTTLAHELHHIGFATACASVDYATLPPAREMLFSRLGAFGEGLAMLAAVGDPTMDPNVDSRPDRRAAWLASMEQVEEGFAAIDRWIVDVDQGRITSADSVLSVAMTFYGDQGPWYTVGWLMSSTIELAFGRQRLIEVMCDPTALMREYQRAAAVRDPDGSRLPRWTDGAMRAVVQKSDDAE